MKLEVSVTDISPSRKELTIEVPAETVKAEYEKTYDAYMRQARLPGFRPGRVPLSVIKQRFGREVKSEVIGQLLPHALSHAIVDHRLRTVGEPSIDPDDISVSEGESMRFKAGVDVIPDFEVSNYRGLKLTKQIVKVDEEDIDKVLAYWREAEAEFTPVEDRPSQAGDFVSVNIVGKYVDPPEEEDLKTDNLEIELGAEGVQPEFTEHLTGVKADDVREFRVQYPADFTSPGLAGKTLDFTATVVAVRRKELPELDDEFAHQFGQVETIAELREKVRQDLEKQAERRADDQVRENLITTILKDYHFEIPPSLLHQQQEARAQEFINRLLTSGLPWEEIRQIDLNAQLKRLHQDVERELRSALVFERIHEIEKIEVSDEEEKAELARRAAASGQTVEQLTDRLTKNHALSSIKASLLYEKTLDLLVSSAEITVEEVTAEEARRRAEAAAALAATTEPASPETAAEEIREEASPELAETDPSQK